VIPVFLAGTAATLLFSWWLGVRQRNTLVVSAGSSGPSPGGEPTPTLPNWQFWANITLVIAVLGTMLAEFAPPAIAFLVGTVLALLINFPRVSDQWDAVTRHGGSAITMVAILLAAGAFTGIMRGTGMLDALARGGADLLPGGSATHLPVIVAVLSMPLSLLFDPDSFYFGILPLLGGIAEHGGVPAIEVGRAAILGQMTTGFPVSPMTPATFLLVGLAKIDLADHQRFTIPYLFALSMVMTVVALALGVFRL
jgi:CitMHS family citrate-Mg2+:H+ or citrate-Ca2+:H+ symporter